MTPIGEYDYVVVGGGSAGCVLANRLTKDGKSSVLLLEAGGKDDWLWVNVPVGYLFSIGNPRTDWCFRTDAEPGLNGRTLLYARGKGLGGCSSINAMVYMRGQKVDYDYWASLGNRGWAWDDVLPVYKRMECHFAGADEFHGCEGELHVQKPRVSWEILDAWRDAAEEAGIPKVEEFNRGDNFGNAYFHMNQRRGERWSASRAWLHPVMGRSNLKVITKAHVKKVVVEARDGVKRATGIELVIEGQGEASAKARKAVILAAGSIGSPQILQLSGIGPAELLGKFAIPVVHELPGVGENLHDHLQIRMMWKVKGPTLNERAGSLFGKAAMAIEYFLFRTGPLTMPPSQLGAFAKSDASEATPDMEWHVQPLSLEKFGDPLHGFPAITPSVCNLRPTSRGWVRILGTDPVAPPSIRLNYLATPGGPARGGRGHALHAQGHGAAGAREIPAERMAAGAGVRIRRGSREGCGRPRHDDLPSRGHLQDGARPGLRGRRPPARPRNRGPARYRRIDHAAHHLRQHQRADLHDRGEGRGIPAFGRAMNARILAFFAALLVLAAAAYLGMKPEDPAEIARGRNVAAASRTVDSGIAARTASAAHGTARVPFPRMAGIPARRSLFNELEHAASYRALYDRLHGSAEGGTAEGLYVQYAILSKCATVTDRAFHHPQRKPIEQRREEFLRALAPDDPLREKRIAAFEGASVDHCAGFGEMKVTRADLEKLLAQSAQEGDPKARAVSVEREIWQARHNGAWSTATLSDSQISTLEQAIATKDPEAMVLAGRLLSNSWPNLTLKVGGADAQPVEPRAFYNAWQILACQYGNACGADNPRLQSECAFNAHCDAQSLPDYLYYYASTPHESELLARYESVLRGAIENGDWSQVVVSRGPGMPRQTTYVFGGSG